MNYSHLYSWRNLCEYLNSRPYKFAETYEIRRDVCCLPTLYGRKRIHRQELWDKYLIQFIHWCQHPADFYRRKRRREEVWGWQLCRDWEHKIAYLESVVLFDVEPTIKQWEPALMLRIQQRKQREERKALEAELKSLPQEKRLISARELKICWQCFSPIVPLMIDCLVCGAKN